MPFVNLCLVSTVFLAYIGETPEAPLRIRVNLMVRVWSRLGLGLLFSSV